jgi:hypothetical protein
LLRVKARLARNDLESDDECGMPAVGFVVADMVDDHDLTA